MRYKRRSPLARLINFLNTPVLVDLSVLILRLWLGIAMIYHGYQTLFLSTEGTKNIQLFIEGAVKGKLGLPFPEFMGYMAKGAEFFGGILVCIGLLTRPALSFIAITMGIAAFWVHAGQPFSELELALGYFVISIVLLLKGPGKLSLDHILAKS